MRAAPGGVDHDGLELRGLERGDGRARQRAGALGLARVRVERATAALGRAGPAPPRPGASRHRMVASLCGRKTASCTQPWRKPTRPRGGPRAGMRSGRAPPRPAGGERRQERLRRREGRREQPQEPARPDEALEPAPLVEAQRTGDQAQEGRSGQEAVERGAPHQAPQRRARAPRLQLGAARLDQVAVGHPRGARALARPAPEAEREMLGRRVVRERDPAVGERLDEVDAAARRVGLLAELRVRRAARQTQAAVDALEELPVLELGEDARPAGRGRRAAGRRSRSPSSCAGAPRRIRSRPRSGRDSGRPAGRAAPSARA